MSHLEIWSYCGVWSGKTRGGPGSLRLPFPISSRWCWGCRLGASLQAREWQSGGSLPGSRTRGLPLALPCSVVSSSSYDCLLYLIHESGMPRCPCFLTAELLVFSPSLCGPVPPARLHFRSPLVLASPHIHRLSCPLPLLCGPSSYVSPSERLLSEPALRASAICPLSPLALP